MPTIFTNHGLTIETFWGYDSGDTTQHFNVYGHLKISIALDQEKHRVVTI